MRTPYRQRGVSLLAWIAILVVVGLFVLFGARTVPAYFDYFTLVSVVEGVQRDPELRGASTAEVREQLETRMRINDVDDVGDVGYDAVIVRQAGKNLTLEIDYEVREPFIANIDLVVSFSRRIGP